MDCRFRFTVLPIQWHMLCALLVFPAFICQGQQPVGWRSAPVQFLIEQVPIDSIIHLPSTKCILVKPTGRRTRDTAVVALWTWDIDSLRLATQTGHDYHPMHTPFDGGFRRLHHRSTWFYRPDGEIDSTSAESVSWEVRAPHIKFVRGTRTKFIPVDALTSIERSSTLSYQRSPWDETDTLISTRITYQSRISRQSHRDSLRLTWISKDSAYVRDFYPFDNKWKERTEVALHKDSVYLYSTVTDIHGRDSIRIAPPPVPGLGMEPGPERLSYYFYDQHGRLVQWSPLNKAQPNTQAFVAAMDSLPSDASAFRAFEYAEFVEDGSRIQTSASGIDIPTTTVYNPLGHAERLSVPTIRTASGQYFEAPEWHYNPVLTPDGVRYTLQDGTTLTITYDHHHRPTSMTWTQGEKNKVVDWVRFWWQD